MFEYFLFIKAWIVSRIDDERGATMVEYGLMIALVALVVAVAAATLGTKISTLFGRASGSLS